MNYRQLVEKVIDSNNGIAKMSMFIAEGISREKYMKCTRRDFSKE